MQKTVFLGDSGWNNPALPFVPRYQAFRKLVFTDGYTRLRKGPEREYFDKLHEKELFRQQNYSRPSSYAAYAFDTISMLKSLLTEEENPSLNLRVYVTGGGCAGFQYGFSFDENKDEGDTEVVKRITDLLDTRVRPAVAQDGGDITFQSFEDGIVYLHMQGACAGCPSSTMTLKMGIENLLKHYVPEVSEVRAVD